MPKLYTADSVLTFTTDTGTDTLQGAVNAAITQKKPLYIAQGTYDLPATLTINGPVKIYGSRYNTYLKPPTGATQASLIVIASTPAGSRLSDVTIEGLRISGLDLPVAGQTYGNNVGLIHAKKVDRLLIRDCFISQSQGSGIQADESAGIIENNEFWSCRTGIGSKLSVGIVIERNYIRDSKDNGIDIWRVQPASPLVASLEGAVIRANKIYTVDNATGGSGQFGNAIVCTLAQGVTITENITLGTKYSGIRLNACANSIVSNNQIYGARETALFIECLGPDVTPYRGITVTGNMLENVGNGIAVVNPENGARRVSVTGNTVSNIVTNTFTQWYSPDRTPANAYTVSTFAMGIQVAGSDVLVQANLVDGNTTGTTAKVGIFMYSSGDWNPNANNGNGAVRSQASVATVIANNHVRACPIGIGYNDYDARGYAEISGNMIIGASAGKNILRLTQMGAEITSPVQTDIGTSTTAITQRYSFDRNKVIAANS